MSSESNPSTTRKSRRLMIALVCVGLALLVSGGYVAVSHAGSLPGSKLTGSGDQPDKPALDQIETILQNDQLSAQDRIDEALSRISLLRSHQPQPQTVQPLNAPDPFGFNDPFFSTGFGGNGADPFQQMQLMQQHMDQMMQSAFGGVGGGLGGLQPGAASFAPQGEFEEKDNAYVYRFDLPGVDKDSVSVTVEDNRMTVEGRRESKVEQDKDGQAYRREIMQGSFQRVLTLPVDVEVSKMTSEMKDGVLTVTLPKDKDAKSNKLAIPIQ